WSPKTCPNRECRGLTFRSIRPKYMSSFTGLLPKDTTLPEGLSGTYWSRFLEGVVMQLGSMILLATQGAPDVVKNGAPVLGFAGLPSTVPGNRSVKSPLRSAAEGTSVFFATPCGRFRNPW